MFKYLDYTVRIFRRENENYIITISVEMIAKKTGLSIEEVKKIKENMER